MAPKTGFGRCAIGDASAVPRAAQQSDIFAVMVTEPPYIAVICTCHDQRNMVESCMKALFEQVGYSGALRAFVVDDGSTDGTGDALASLNYDITILPGDGTLFWAAGMEMAERAALATTPDLVLWLNADTLLDADAMVRLMKQHMDDERAIVVGATRDPVTGEGTYGGRLRASSWHPQRFERLPIRDVVQKADTFNGNVVLVPRKAREVVGPIDGLFPHAYADDDYGLRAGRLGVPMVQVPGTVAACRANGPGTRVRRGPAAWRAMQSPKGLPFLAQARFLRRHGGPLWPLVLAGQQAALFLGLRAVNLP